MKVIVIAWLLTRGSLPAMAETIPFDQDAVGSLPSGWIAGVTGRGTPKWTIEVDPTAPSPPNVLKQSGSGTFPWCVKKEIALTDGVVEVKFKPISGNEDQAGGLVWRWKDGDNYYVARANALEDNVSLHYTQNGRRNTIKYVDAPVAKNRWHTSALSLRPSESAFHSTASSTSRSTTTTLVDREPLGSGLRPIA